MAFICSAIQPRQLDFCIFYDIPQYLITLKNELRCDVRQSLNTTISQIPQDTDNRRASHFRNVDFLPPVNFFLYEGLNNALQSISIYMQ